MIPRVFQGATSLWSYKTGLMAALAVLGMSLSAQAQCQQGGGQRSGGQMSGGSMAGMGGMGGGSSTSSGQVSAAMAQMETNAYLNNMQASHNMMMQQVHAHQNRQREAMIQASANRKRLAAEKAIQVANKSKTKSSSAKSSAIELTQAN